MNKKIVILALHLGTGGAEKVISNLANLLSENNDVEIISTYKLRNSPAFYISNKVTINYLTTNLEPNKQEIKNALKNFNLIRLVFEAFKSFKILILRKKLMVNAIKNLDCDIVISTRILHNNWVSKYARKDIIKIAQEHNHHNNNQKYIKKLIKSLKNFDYFMPVSRELCDFYSKRINNTKVVYIPNFIDNVSSKTCDLSSKQLISVGRLDPIKGFDDLIDLFNLFYQKYPDWNLHIVGDGPEKEILQTKIHKLGLSKKITLCGTKYSEELENEYLNSSIYVMTSHSESFGLVLVEAANYGLPLIAFDSAQGANEIIENNKNGFLVKNRNAEEMITKIEELLNDSSKMQYFSKNSKNTALKFSKEAISKEWNKFLNNI
jgi:hypothetical protein